MKTKKTLALLAFLILAQPALAGTLIVTYAGAGNATYTLSSSESAIVSAYVAQLNAAGASYASHGDWLLKPVSEALDNAKRSVERASAANVSAPENAAVVVPTPRCVAVGLSAGCTTGALRDAICAGLGVPAPCRLQR